MFVLYLMKLVFYALWFTARLAWSLVKLAGRLLLSLIRIIEDAVEVDDRGFRCRGRKTYA